MQAAPVRHCDLRFSGGISNSGSIVSVTDAGILVENGDTFSGGINNSGAINTNGIMNPRGIAAFTVDTFFGGISNFGTINSRFIGIAVDESTQLAHCRYIRRIVKSPRADVTQISGGGVS